MKRAQDTYQEPQIMHFPGVIARVHRPVLDEAERERRMEKIKKAAERVLLATEKRQKGII